MNERNITINHMFKKEIYVEHSSHNYVKTEHQFLLFELCNIVLYQLRYTKTILNMLYLQYNCIACHHEIHQLCVCDINYWCANALVSPPWLNSHQKLIQNAYNYVSILKITKTSYFNHQTEHYSLIHMGKWHRMYINTQNYQNRLV